ncbi:MAG: RNA methyltransferase [Microscillaceae bacterium]|nr:RNA methyltransferase [Microscillaceae bacterium]
MFPLLTPSRQALLKRVLAQRTRYLTVVLEEAYQAHNAGAVVRSCEAFGLQEVYVIDKYHRTESAWQLSRGAAKWVNINVYEGGGEGRQQCWESLKQKGYQVVVATPHQAQKDLASFVPTQRTAFWFGSEKKGISTDILQKAEGYLHIPIYGFVESFNVSVAVALVLQAMVDKIRQLPDCPWPLNPEEQNALMLEWTEKSLPNGPKLRAYYETQVLSEKS